MTEDFDSFPGTTTRARSAARPPEDLHDPQGPEPVRDDSPLPVAVLWASKSNGPPHVVTVVNDPRGRRLQCVCTSASIRGDCWAVTETRRLFGWPEAERT